MLTQETAAKIWASYREIAAANKLLADMAELEEKNKCAFNGEHHAKLQDAFGRHHDLQLGIPSGDDGHRLFNVHPDLALAVIKAHLANQQAELVRLNEIAKVELGIEVQE